MKAKRLLVAVFCINLLACFSTALSDGGMFFRWTPRNDILQPTQKVYIRWDGSQEKLLVQTKYQGPAEEMAWIVPVPSKPTVVLGDGTVFESLSKETTYLDVSYTDFVGLHSYAAGGGTGGRTTPVEWREQIGEYDVVLLRPVGEEDAVQWLQSNEFAVPGEIVPVLKDYIRNQWWMVAARIHPDALTNITREKLGQGLLHPLEMTFGSPACVYPMRLTSMAAGPVEELIYIEGPRHYEPATLANGNWEISIFGGPIRQVLDSTGLSDLEIALRTKEGKTETTPKRYLTKLRRVFQPTEMTDDLVFREIDYSVWLASQDSSRAAQAATQYGRRRDPNGVPYLLGALSPVALEQARPAPGDYSPALPASAKSLSWEGLSRQTVACRHLRSCLWALGEIGIEHVPGASVEETLLYCAGHDNQLIRMEACVALIKLGSPKIGATFAGRISQVLPPESTPREPFWLEGTIFTAEMNTIINWIVQFGTAVEKDVLVAALSETIPRLPMESEFYVSTWPEWVMKQAAKTGDPHLVQPLERLLAAVPSNFRWTRTLILETEIACGASEAMEPFILGLLAKEDQVLADGTPTDGSGYGSLYGYYDRPVGGQPYQTSLRVQILQGREENRHKSGLDILEPQTADGILRQTIGRNRSTDWYTLYLLSLIQEPNAEDQNRLMEVLRRCPASARVVAIDVLYLWADTTLLLGLYGQADFADLKSETAWALAALGRAEAVATIQEQIWSRWNVELMKLNTTFVDAKTLSFEVAADPFVADAVRKAETLWNYFHPQGARLDAGRLELLKRLGADGAIRSGLRYLLIGSDYGSTEWGKPLLEKAARDILGVDISYSTVDRVTFTIAVAGDGDFLVSLCREPPDEFPRNLLNGMLFGRNSNLLPVVQACLGQIWPQRYTATGGQSVLFREPAGLSTVLDSYARSVKGMEDFLESLVKDASLAGGYRAFLLVNWPKASSRISKDYATGLLDWAMPDFLREALQKRLLNWQ